MDRIQCGDCGFGTVLGMQQSMDTDYVPDVLRFYRSQS